MRLKHNFLMKKQRLHLRWCLYLASALIFMFAVFVRATPESRSFNHTESSGREKSTPAGDKTRISSAEPSTAGESYFTNLDGARIHYVDYGTGSDALVLIHGWTCNIDNWRDQLPEFAKRNRVIAIDLPGHGLSDKPQITYSMDLFARAVDAVMRDAKVKRAVMVGHSMGTPVARQFYRNYPKKTLAIVIVDGALRPFGDKAMMDRLIAGFRSPNYKETATQMFAGMMGPSLSAEAQERIKTSFLNTPQHVVVSAMEGMADTAIWGDDKINVPVLAIMAKNPFYPPNIEASYRGIAPYLEFQMWDGVGHFIMMEKPVEFNTAVLSFLEKHKLLAHAVKKTTAADAIEREIRLRLEQWIDALKRNDLKLLDDILADDFQFILSDGNTRNKNEELALNRAGDIMFDSLATQDVKVFAFGDTAIATGVGIFKGTYKGKPFESRERFFDVYQKRRGRWRVIASRPVPLPAQE